MELYFYYIDIHVINKLTLNIKVFLHSMVPHLILLVLTVVVMKVGVTVKLHMCCGTTHC